MTNVISEAGVFFWCSIRFGVMLKGQFF